MVAAPRSPLEGTDRLIVDGTNLLYRLGSMARGATGSAGVPAPPAAIIGRVRAAIPAAITIDLVFDGIGHGVKGRVAQGMFVRYAGRRPADDLILDLAASAETDGDPAASARLLVVTNDRDLRARLESRGVRSRPVVWLTNRLDMPKLSSPAPGNRRPPIGQGSPGGPGGVHDGDDDAERRGWRPGRGATTKTGPAHKIARHKRHPRHTA